MRKTDHESRPRKDGSELWPLCSKDQCPHMGKYLHSPWWDLNEAFSLFRSHPPSSLWNKSQVFCGSQFQGLETLQTRGCNALTSSQTTSLLHCAPLLTRWFKCLFLCPELVESPTMCLKEKFHIVSNIFCGLKLTSWLFVVIWLSPSLFTICYIVYWTLILAKHCQFGSYLP